MNFWEIFTLILGGAGVFASILGAFLSWASKVNGRETRKLIEKESESTRQLIEKESESTRQLIEKESESTHQLIKGMNEILLKISALISSEGEKTRDLIKNIMTK